MKIAIKDPRMRAYLEGAWNRHVAQSENGNRIRPGIRMGAGAPAERLRDHPAMRQFKAANPEVRHGKQRSEYGVHCLGEDSFDPNKPRRLIKGIAISSRAPNAKGGRYVAAELRFSLPCPLFFNHDPGRLIGRVLSCYALGDEVRFLAELKNGPHPGFADRAWDDISERKLTAVSVGAVLLSEHPTNDKVGPWGLRELSICRLGVDRGAEITCCWEQLPGPVEPGFRAPTKTFWEGPLTIFDSDLVDRTWNAPRATDDPIETRPSEYYGAHAARTEVAELRASLRRLLK